MIELELLVQDSPGADKGNLFVTTIVHSQNEKRKPAVYHRMTHLKSRLTLWGLLKKFLNYLPLVCHLVSCETSHVLTIPLIDHFDNSGAFHAR